jgi:hypothetical protein
MRLSVFCLGLALAASPGLAACPSSCISVPPASCSTAARTDTTIAAPACANALHAGYDIPQGILFLTASSTFGGCTPAVTVVDDYVVHGALGSPGTFGAILEVIASWECGITPGSIDVNLTEGTANNARNYLKVTDIDCFFGPPTRTFELYVPLAVTPETPFRLTSSLAFSLGQQQAFDVHGTLRFTGLPTGSAITSCKGYVEGAVPARATSWGKLKAGYR